MSMYRGMSLSHVRNLEESIWYRMVVVVVWGMNNIQSSGARELTAKAGRQ